MYLQRFKLNFMSQTSFGIFKYEVLDLIASSKNSKKINQSPGTAISDTERVSFGGSLVDSPLDFVCREKFSIFELLTV